MNVGSVSGELTSTGTLAEPYPLGMDPPSASEPDRQGDETM